MALTQLAAGYCRFGADSRLLDVAAGAGETVRFLRRTLGCQAAGLDSDPSRWSADVSLGRAEALPYPDRSFDGVFLECALSQMAQPEAVLAQCARVLTEGGWLVLSDLYARTGPDAPSTPLGRLDRQAALEDRLRRVGLEPVRFEDHSRALTALRAGGRSSCPDWPKGVGYCLCTAQKGGGTSR